MTAPRPIRRAPDRRPRTLTAAAVGACAALALATACSRGTAGGDASSGPVVGVADARAAAALTGGPTTTASPTPSAPSAPPATRTRTTATTRRAPATARPEPRGSVTPETVAAPTPEAPTTSTPAPAVGVFRGDGLGFARFGDDAETTVTRLQERVGPADSDSTWITEDGETFRQLTFGLLTVDLREEGGVRRFIGAYYLVPGPGTAATPRLDTDPAHGLAGDAPVTLAEVTAGVAVTAAADLPGAWCFASPSGTLCAYVSGISLDEHGDPRPPTPDAVVTGLTAGRIAFRGHCGL